jgi:hypothetical protein
MVCISGQKKKKERKSERKRPPIISSHDPHLSVERLFVTQDVSKRMLKIKASKKWSFIEYITNSSMHSVTRWFFNVIQLS